MIGANKIFCQFRIFMHIKKRNNSWTACSALANQHVVDEPVCASIHCSSQRNFQMKIFFSHLCCLLLSMSFSPLAQAESTSNFCHKTADYFSDFYEGLFKMNSHGFKNFSPNSADQQAYFIQVQKTEKNSSSM